MHITVMESISKIFSCHTINNSLIGLTLLGLQLPRANVEANLGKFTDWSHQNDSNKE